MADEAHSAYRLAGFSRRSYTTIITFNMLCRATTKSGPRCTRQADDSGYCAQHDPRNPEEKEKAAKDLQRQQSRFDDVLEIVQHTCEVTSWSFQVDSVDEKTWRYATVRVQKVVPSTPSSHEVVGQFHVVVQDGVRISLTKTSFHGYGLEDLHRSIMNELNRLPWLESPKKKSQEPRLDIVLRLINRFHVAANQLKRRYSNRETLRINDEYDVQDLLHAFLKLHFDDIRPEEYAPSKAGAASRLDFLLKGERIVVEAKMASASLNDKRIGEQLIIDIERYKAHPDCDKLVCFVYDPDHQIRNPIGLEKDLSRKGEALEVIVIVVPK
jgi:hypothetical protein